VRVAWDFKCEACRYSVWEAGVSLHGFRLFLVQYISTGSGRAVILYLLGAGVTLSWGKKGVAQ